MASYLITGVSRGLGWEFMTQLSKNPANTILGLVRDKETTEKRVKEELSDRKNIHIFKAELQNYDTLKASVEAVSSVTGGKLDYLIANAAWQDKWSSYDTLDVLGESPKHLHENMMTFFEANVVGNVHLYNLYMPLILKGNAKKVITISSGLGDIDNVAQYGLYESMPYSVSKTAINMVVAKYAAQYGKDGVLFLALSPGVVDVGAMNEYNEKQLQQVQLQFGKFLQLYPDFKGPITPEESIKAMLSVVENSSVDKGHSGAFLSHHGDKRWI